MPKDDDDDDDDGDDGHGRDSASGQLMMVGPTHVLGLRKCLTGSGAHLLTTCFTFPRLPSFSTPVPHNFQPFQAFLVIVKATKRVMNIE